MKDQACFSTSRILVGLFLAACLALSLSGCTLVMSSEAPTLATAKVTTPEISENGVLKVGVNTSQSPLAGMGSTKIVGIDVDIAGALADELGLKVKIVDTGSTPSKSIANGEVDLAFGVDKADAPSGVKLTDPYIPTAVAYFKKQGTNPTSLESGTPKIGAQGSSKSAWTVTNAFGSSAISATTDLAGSFQSLSSGTVEYVAADAVIGMYAANKTKVDVEIAGIASDASGYCVAIAEKNTTFYSTVSDALAKLVENGTIATIQKKWLGGTVDLTNVTKINRKAASGTGTSSGTTTSESLSASGTTATDANSVRSSSY